jgi:zinc protease
MLIGQYVNNFLQKTPMPGAENRYKFLQQILPAITLAEVNAVAKKMPSTNNAFALVQAPARLKDKLPDNAGVLNTLVAASRKEVKPYEEKAVAARLLDKEPVPGRISSETKNEKLGTSDITLSNGITVTLKPTTFKNDEILMDAWRWGGFQQFDIADKVNAEQAANIVRQMGVAGFSPTDLRKYLAGKTVAASPYINSFEDGIEGRSSVKDFEIFLQLVYLYFTEPRKDKALFNSYVTRQKSQLQFLKQNPQAFFADTTAKVFYNNNPWADGIPGPEDFDKLDLDRSFDIYHQLFGNPYGMHFTFVGKVEDPNIRVLLEKYLGALPTKEKENKYRDNGIRLVKGPQTINVKKGKESQSFITMMFEGAADDNRDARIRLAAVIEAINIKITEKLREEMSGIYGGGLSGSIEKRPYVHFSVVASIPCGPENVGKLTDSLVSIIKHFQQFGPDQKDLDKVKETWKKQYHVGLQSNDYWLDKLSSAWINRDNPEDILDFEQRVNALTTADLKEAAQKFIPLDQMVKAILYPENAAVPETQKKAF